jgi:hypothetical protein
MGELSQNRSSLLKKSSISSSLVREALLRNVGKGEQVGERTNSPFEKVFFMDDSEQVFMGDSSAKKRAEHVKA